jgi:hypothetical protein
MQQNAQYAQSAHPPPKPLFYFDLVSLRLHSQIQLDKQQAKSITILIKTHDEQSPDDKHFNKKPTSQI